MKSDARIFADDTSIFNVVHDVNQTHSELVHDLQLVEKWGFQWKMAFNPDPTKPPTEVIFSTKTKPPHHPNLFLIAFPLPGFLIKNI